MDKQENRSTDQPVTAEGRTQGIDTATDQPKVSLAPLGQFFKRRSEFFEAEALSFAIQFERLAQGAKE